MSYTIVNTPNPLARLVFGGHFYPWHVSAWIVFTFYHAYQYIVLYTPIELLVGFTLIATLFGLTEYVFHRFLLHRVMYAHHKKHHQNPLKLALVNTPMSLVCLNTAAWMLAFHRNVYLYHMFTMFIGVNYLAFESIHLLAHSYTGSNRIVLNAKQYHKFHHCNNRVHFSFQTPLWDYLFGTLAPAYKVTWYELLLGFIPFYSFAVK